MTPLKKPPVDSSHFVNPIGAETAGIEPTMAPAVERPRQIAPPPRKGLLANIVPVAVASGLMMEFLDSTALSTALPTLARAFHSDPVHLKLALTAYLLTLAVFAPASGWVADRFGPKRVFLSAMAVFLLGSALCGLSQTLPQLVAARILQGSGGAMMNPVGRLIVVSSAPRDRFVSAMTWFTMPALLGPLMGPPLAGFILGVADWPWIFYINIPIGIVGLLAVGRFVPALRQPDPGRFDAGGFLLAALAIVSLSVVAETAGVGLAPVAVELVATGIGCLALGAFVRHALRSDNPVLAIRLLKGRAFRTSVVAGNLVRLGLGATPLLLPLLLQIGFGWSPVRAGLLTISQAFGALAFKPVATRIIARLGYRRVLVISATGTALTVAAPAAFHATTPALAIVAVLALSGFLRSMQFTTANALAYADIERPDVSRASTLSTVLQQLAMSFGVSIGGLSLHLARGHGGLTPDHFVVPFLAMGLLSLLAVGPYMALPHDVGARMGGRAQPAS
jgi:EmrB/QacA subfamily drug resistance transporter